MENIETFQSAFICSNFKCLVDFEEIIDNNTNKKVKNIVIKQDCHKKIKLAYIFGEGLKEVTSMKTKKNKQKNNILGEFLGIKKNDIESYISFFKKYGFLFEMDDGENYKKISIKELENIKSRLYSFVLIMNNQNTSYVNYKELIDSTLFLLLTKKTGLYIDNTEILTATKNIFSEKIESAIKPKPKTNNIKILKNENQQDEIYYTVDDTISKKTIELKVEEVEKVLDSNDFSDLKKQVLKAYIDKKILFNTDKEKIAIDFLYNFMFNISDFCKHHLYNNNIFVDEVYSYFSEKNNKNLQLALLDVSKMVLEIEFNEVLSNIHPIYDVEKMSPNWNLPSLYSALYLSLFYLNSRQSSYRICQNEMCNQYFLVSNTNNKKKYCSPSCTNAVSSRKYNQKRQR